MRGPILLAFVVLVLHHPRSSAETYRCVSFEYPPLISQLPGSRAPSGFAVELVQHLFGQLGAEVTVKLYPWQRALTMVKLGEADCIFTVYRHPERERFLDYGEQLVSAQIIHLYARKEAALSFNGDLTQILPLRIGVVRELNYGPRFEQLRASLRTDEASSIEQNFLKLAAGRVDLVPSNLPTAMATLALPTLRREAAMIVQLSPPVEIVPDYVAFSKRRRLTDLRDRFDMALKKFRTTAEYRRLLEKYQLESSLDLQGALAPDTN